MGLDLGGQSGERELLYGLLDWDHAVVENKLAGLDSEQASRVMTPSGLSMLGVVNHLAWVEMGWMQDTFAGEAVPVMADALDNSIQFRLGPADTMDSVLAFYRDQVGRSRQIADRAALEEPSAREAPFFGKVSLRWVLTHLLEETARHLGHLDLMREEIDGRTGD